MLSVPVVNRFYGRWMPGILTKLLIEGKHQTVRPLRREVHNRRIRQIETRLPLLAKRLQCLEKQV